MAAALVAQQPRGQHLPSAPGRCGAFQQQQQQPMAALQQHASAAAAGPDACKRVMGLPARGQRRRGCTRCLQCSGLATHSHTYGASASSSGSSDEFQEWWPAGIQSPTVYFALRARQLAHNTRAQAIKPTPGLWREPADTAAAAPSTLRAARGLGALRLAVPSSCTNVAQGDISVKFVNTIQVKLYRLEAPCTAPPASKAAAHAPANLAAPPHRPATPGPFSPRQQQQHAVPAARTAPAAAGAGAGALQRTLSGTRRKSLSLETACEALGGGGGQGGAGAGDSPCPALHPHESEVKRSRMGPPARHASRGHIIAPQPRWARPALAAASPAVLAQQRPAPQFAGGAAAPAAARTPTFPRQQRGIAQQAQQGHTPLSAASDVSMLSLLGPSDLSVTGPSSAAMQLDAPCRPSAAASFSDGSFSSSCGAGSASPAPTVISIISTGSGSFSSSAGDPMSFTSSSAAAPAGGAGACPSQPYAGGGGGGPSAAARSYAHRVFQIRAEQSYPCQVVDLQAAQRAGEEAGAGWGGQLMRPFRTLVGGISRKISPSRE